MTRTIEIPWLGEYLKGLLPIEIRLICMNYCAFSCSISVEYILSQAKEHGYIGIVLRKELDYIHYNQREDIIRDAQALKWEGFVNDEKYKSNQLLVNLSEEILVALCLNGHPLFKCYYVDFVPILPFQLNALELVQTDEHDDVYVDERAVDMHNAVQFLEQGRVEQTLNLLRKSLKTWEFRHTFTGINY